MNSTRSHRRGFTLIELVTTITLLGILGTAVTVPIMVVAQGQARTEQRFDLLDQGRVALLRWVQEARAIERLGATGPDLRTATDEMVAFGDVHYRLDGAEWQRSEDDGTTWKTIAGNVTSLEYTYFDLDNGTLSQPLDAADRQTVRRVRVAITLGVGAETLTLESSAYFQEFAFKDG